MPRFLPRNTLPAPAGFASSFVGKSLPRVDLEAILRAAIDEVGVQHKVVAICMELSPSHFSEMLAGKGDRHLTLNHVESAPDEVVDVFARRFAEARTLIVSTRNEHLDAVADTLTALGRLTRVLSVNPSPRMAKADLPAVKKEQAR